jgi:hypothetical protein
MSSESCQSGEGPHARTEHGAPGLIDDVQADRASPAAAEQASQSLRFLVAGLPQLDIQTQLLTHISSTLGW